ncbi:MAG: RNA-directed polymerase [Chthoniobacter sp.]|jgi:hypothetical protein|nr:RNA-directed polymerase [Chthoniobacter sp.]
MIVLAVIHFEVLIVIAVVYFVVVILPKLIGLFRRPRRSTARLHTADDETGADVVSEEVDLSGGPLKPGHRRRALRDPRLLPKNKAKGQLRAMARLKRRKVMTKEEGDRLFAGTLRTRNRQLRDLLPDEEQLVRLHLPIWRSEDDVAAALGLTRKQLWFFATHRERDRHPHYVTFSIPKRRGGRRVIMAPKRGLKAVQRAVLAALVDKLPVSEHAHAFRHGRNVRTGAEPHVGKRHVLRLDLKDFFPSVTFARVRGYFISLGYGYPVAATLAVLLTEAERQPVVIEGETFHVPIGERHCVQGAPTSPGLCNAIVLKLDHRLAGLARKHGLAYTRYADDLSFSGDLDRTALLRVNALARRIIREEGFVVNDAKTRLTSQGRRQTVTGVVVNQTLGLSRQERRRLRATAHKMNEANAAGAINGEAVATFRGKLAWLAMLNPAQASALRVRCGSWL